MERLRPWLDAVKPEQALLAPLAVAVGSAYAVFDARPGPGFVATLLVAPAALLAGAGVNLLDHAWDRLGAPGGDPKSPIPESARPVDAREAAVAGAAALAAAALLGLASVPVSGGAWLGYGALAVALGILRGAPGLGFDTVGFGLGDLANILALGPLAALAGFASQAGEGSWGACLVGLPSGVIAAAPLFARHFTRRSSDDRLQRITPVVALGADRARAILAAFPLAAAAAVVLAARAGDYTPWTRLAALPLAIAAAAAWRLPPSPDETSCARYGRVAAVCAIAALACVAAAIGLAAHP